MHKAALYQRSNGLQRRDAKEVLDEFSYNFNFRSDGTDTLMDIGCGSGDVTIDFILPLLPLNFKRLVGSDLSDQMIRYAQESYQHPKIAFQKLDIGSGDLTGYLETVEPFDHITSFYCLHWVQNQKNAMQNIFDLLQPDGDCLVAFLAANPIFEIYKQMSQTIRWSNYMADVNRYISPYQYSVNPIKELEKTLLAVGFSDYQVDVRDKMFIFDGLDILKKSVRAVNPFLDRIPTEEHDDFLNDYVSIVSKMQLTEINQEKDDCKFLTPYKLLIAYAKK